MRPQWAKLNSYLAALLLSSRQLHQKLFQSLRIICWTGQSQGDHIHKGKTFLHYVHGIIRVYSCWRSAYHKCQTITKEAYTVSDSVFINKTQMQWLNYLQCLPSYRNSLTVLCIRNYCAWIMWIIHMVSWTWKTILLSNHVHCFCESTMDYITRVCLLMKFQLLLEALQEMLTGRWQTDSHTHTKVVAQFFLLVVHHFFFSIHNYPFHWGLYSSY